ncbi:E3 ubiquitin-protein ligase Siah1-like [Anticarsia gemmatalis]|uniref:E3 ubiquitin-protein ligase Siah1-like n=1 Tax=Anticarsia gemmatalis TaxID=129554 RepID=UPI003F75794E
MSTAKPNRKAAAVAVELPECPVCLETMSAPIYQCQSGHSLCNICTQNLMPPICPICRLNVTQMRNWQLEEIVSKAKVPCPNKSFGCIYTMVAKDMDEHIKECIFRAMDCPLGVVFGKCSWSGKLKEIMEHFKDRHPENCNVATDEEVEISNVDIKKDDRHVYLVAQSKMHFVITMKIDTLQKMAYWTIQLIGSKKAARDHIYEIHVISKQTARRKVVFIEHCFNDALKADEVFRMGKCAVLPLDSLVHFIQNKKMSFRFFIKRIPNDAQNNKGDGKDNNKPPGPKGPGNKGPNKPPNGPKGPKPNKA